MTQVAAMAPGTTTGKPPLRLKDLLELDCESCSAAGFRCYPRRLGLAPEASSSLPMRHLLESPSTLSLSLRRPRPGRRLSHLSRSLSRRLRAGFWRRRDEEEAAAAAAVCSSCSEAEEETSSESSDNSSGRTATSRSRSGSSDFSSSASSASGSTNGAAAGHDDGHEEEAMPKRGPSSSGSSEADDKEEQLSPVAVMDFPSDDDDDEDCDGADGGECAASFSLARLQRRKAQRQQQRKVRRSFVTADEEVAPADLDARLAATSGAGDLAVGGGVVSAQQMNTIVQRGTDDCAATPACIPSGGVRDVPDEPGLLAELLLVTGAASAGADGATERLLLDYFVEMARRLSEQQRAAPGLLPREAHQRLGDDCDETAAAAAAAARGWLDGGSAGGERRWGLADVLRGGEAVVAEMERGRRWMQAGVEEREVGAVVAEMLADQLVDEVVRCLFVLV